MNKIIFLLSKDAMPLETLPIYGNKVFKTPNIDELASKGTVFKKHYATGASTAMSMSSMLTGKNPYEFESRKIYVDVKPNEYESIFDILQKKGYSCHLIWDKTWMNTAWKYVREFGDENKTIIHNLDIAQPVGSHKKKELFTNLKRDDIKLRDTLKQIYETIDSIDFKKTTFIWMHLPHVLKGRICYTDDMDIFDEIVGYVRKRVGDENIYLTTDHGHMNMHKGLVGYGFNVYEPIIKVPLITPRINNLKEVNFMTSHLELKDIILNNEIKEMEYCIADSTYYCQPNRVITVIGKRFKYIFNKEDKSEELYDLVYDPMEEYNILKQVYYEKNRTSWVRYDELHYYPYNNEAMKELETLKGELKKIYRCGTPYEEFKIRLKNKIGVIKRKLKNL